MSHEWLSLQGEFDIGGNIQDGVTDIVVRSASCCPSPLHQCPREPCYTGFHPVTKTFKSSISSSTSSAQTLLNIFPLQACPTHELLISFHRLSASLLNQFVFFFLLFSGFYIYFSSLALFGFSYLSSLGLWWADSDHEGKVLYWEYSFSTHLTLYRENGYYSSLT